MQSLWLGTVAYRDAWRLQQSLAESRWRNEIGDCVLLLEHPPVYTTGRNCEPAHLKRGVAVLTARGADVVDVDRGGSVTFHGPGQLVAYPIVAVADIFPLGVDGAQGDVLRYLRALESALIETAAASDVVAHRRPPYTGVWIGNRKLAAIGVKLARGVSTHGIALNVTTDLAWFDHVIPCGIADSGVTSIAALTHRRPSVADVGSMFAVHLANCLGLAPADANDALRDAVQSFEAVSTT